ncbi:MAG TPA: D-alanyl-D-alanine carboxypeptidase [Actinomycetota bacterium]|nr:D-alanyl-D-alanine carboxypeptidase [Actinomycetota bacterium]
MTGVPSAATGVPSAQVPPAGGGGGGGGDPTIARVGPAIDVRPAEAPWTRALDRIVGGPHVSVAVGLGDTIVYAHAGRVDRIPASGQKLLTSIAALDRFGPAHRFPTIAAGRRPRDGVVRGDLWLVGAGDPELHAARLGALADRLVAEGIRRITGSVVGDTSAFGRRWWAPGWVMDLSRLYVRRPTALTYEGNVHAVPELAAAGALTSALRERGVVVGGDATTGDAPDRPHELARVTSAPLHELLVRQNHSSLNLHAEVLLRALGASSGRPTGAGGARAVEGVAADAGLLIRARDGSGLSHGDRISAIELTSMLLIGASRPWGPALEASLPRSGEGTLRGRLLGVPVRAKTGTLFTVPCSTLAGFVRDAGGTRVAFAVLSEGISKSSSMAIEDAVVRLLAASQVG